MPMHTLSQCIFFAKANFSNDMPSFVKWFNDKLDSTFIKITIPELKQKTDPLFVFYKNMIKNYFLQAEEDNFFDRILNN